DRYDSGSIRLPRFGKPPVGAPAIALHNGRELLRTAKQPLSNAQIKELRRGYLAGISYLDAQVGKVLQELERLRLRENTVVVFWSDHGFHLGEHSLWCKTSNFEHDAHVPLIIAAPNANRPGAKTAALVELLDLYPTLVDLCEVTTPTKLEGVSLRPLLIDSTAVVKRAAYTQHPRPAYYQGRPDAMGVSVRTDRYRYTEWRKFDSGEVVARELYDHQLDPGENLNTVDSPADAEQFQVAQRLLLEKFPRGRRSNGLRE
ncbi:MAG: sulfatase-like hydrolase/transferase, partial [Pirellulaceae bacterium]|nr:sulfatase-like hydrolase/transferase [Pirellulaceae bacterium]